VTSGVFAGVRFFLDESGAVLVESAVIPVLPGIITSVALPFIELRLVTVEPLSSERFSGLFAAVAEVESAGLVKWLESGGESSREDAAEKLVKIENSKHTVTSLNFMEPFKNHVIYHADLSCLSTLFMFIDSLTIICINIGCYISPWHVGYAA
jgi:hypothetical protein